jgi:hypothetical protein
LAIIAGHYDLTGTQVGSPGLINAGQAQHGQGKENFNGISGGPHAREFPGGTLNLIIDLQYKGSQLTLKTHSK